MKENEINGRGKRTSNFEAIYHQTPNEYIYKKKDAPPSDCNGDRVVTVSEFDYCMDNHFRAIETISKLCGEDDEDYYALQQTEIQRFS